MLNKATTNLRFIAFSKKNDETFTRPKKTIDYFVKLKNGIMGKIKFYVRHAGDKYFILEEFEQVEHLNHISEIESNQIVSVHHVSEIHRKMIYMNFKNKHFVTCRPNEFESD